MENLEKALSLMGIGMITVFFVLAVVVAAGNLLIRIINAVAPADGQKPPEKNSHQPSPQKIAAITSAVYHVLGGQGKIERIEKL